VKPNERHHLSESRQLFWIPDIVFLSKVMPLVAKARESPDYMRFSRIPAQFCRIRTLGKWEDGSSSSNLEFGHPPKAGSTLALQRRCQAGPEESGALGGCSKS
jgi:hypothetical protein